MLYGLLVEVSMLFNMSVVSSCSCISVPLVSVNCAVSHVVSCAL